MLRTTRRTALLLAALAAAVASFVAASGSGIAAPAQDGEWSAPISWPIVAVHMSLEPTGEVFSLDGFDNAVNSERLWNPTTGIFQRGSLRPQPLLLRSRAAPGRPDADRGRAHQRLRRSRRHDALQPDDEHVLPGRRTWPVGRWYPTATQLPDGRVLAFAGDNIVQDRPGAAAALLGRVGQLAAVGLRPEDEHVDEPAERPSSRHRSTRSCSSSRTGASSTPARTQTTRILDTGDVDVVDGRHEPDSTATAPSCTGPTRS